MGVINPDSVMHCRTFVFYVTPIAIEVTVHSIEQPHNQHTDL